MRERAGGPLNTLALRAGVHIPHFGAVCGVTIVSRNIDCEDQSYTLEGNEGDRPSLIIHKPQLLTQCCSKR